MHNKVPQKLKIGRPLFTKPILSQAIKKLDQLDGSCKFQSLQSGESSGHGHMATLPFQQHLWKPSQRKSSIELLKTENNKTYLEENLYYLIYALSFERTFVNFNRIPVSTTPPKKTRDFAALEVGELGLAHPWVPCETMKKVLVEIESMMMMMISY